MKSLHLFLVSLAACILPGAVSSWNSFPSSMIAFSAGFEEPSPPLLNAEYQANFIQHKWNQNLSHITTGFIQNSPSQNFVRVDEVYDGNLASSFFDYTNTTKEGLVDNVLTTFDAKSKESTIWRDYVNSNFPLFSENLLVEYGAVFGGLVERQFNEGFVAAWNIMYQGVIPVTVYVNEANVTVGYDYFSPGLRTRVITAYFNVKT
ncbi:hypothetical protein PENSTE_c037G10419 [Penicillium steckii]|uniref:Uncharacterized protein n=1 Tax=Penicillium steckii TaxID=303698 RepID=A0A1V6SKL3_9EURO|nr:hypothetical protein PENSTE_c037G10419 [Penicillium steckii]